MLFIYSAFNVELNTLAASIMYASQSLPASFLFANALTLGNRYSGPLESWTVTTGLVKKKKKSPVKSQGTSL